MSIWIATDAGVTSIVIFELIKRLILVYNNSLSTWPGNGFHSLIMSINILKLIIEGRTLNPTQFPFQYQKMHWWREESENISIASKVSTRNMS